MSRKNKGFFEIKKAPAKCCEGLELGNRDTNDPRQIPEKQGLSTIADNAGTQFGTQSNYFEQIIDLFDRLTPEEQAALLDVLKERAPAV